MELVLYYIIESRIFLCSFLIFGFIIGGICFYYMRDFSQEKKSKVILYGLLLQMSNTDIIRISTIIIKAFTVIYGAIILNQTQIIICLIVMILLTIIYCFCSPKRAVYEIICTFIQMIMLYLINIINNYETDVEDTTFLLISKIILICFATIFTIYLFFREIDIISNDRENKRIKKVIKEENKKEEIGNA